MSSAAVANPMVSAFDKAACAIKIQRWWRKIKSDAVVVEETVADDVLECAICYEAIGDRDSATTTCGHKFHFSCLAKTQTSRGSDGLPCPMCRNPLVEAGTDAQEDYDAWEAGHEAGFAEGRDMYEEYYHHRAEHDAEYEQAAYDSGLVDGRSIANEDLRLMRAELDRVRESLRAQTELSTNLGEIMRQLTRERDAARRRCNSLHRHVSVPSHPNENSKI